MDKQRLQLRPPRVVGQLAAAGARFFSGERVRFLTQGAARFALVAVLSRAVVLGDYAPFGLAMAGAMLAHGAGFSALCGLFAGIVLGAGGRGAVYAAAGLLVLCVESACGGLRVLQKPWFVPSVCALSAGLCTAVFLPIGAGLTVQEVLSFLAAQLLCGGACFLYQIALSPPEEENSWKKPATLLAITATGLLALSDLMIAGLFAPARVAAMVLVLAAAYLGGPMAGAAAGVAFGGAMDLPAASGALFTCGYGLTALVAGLFYKTGRGWFAGVALAAGLCASLLGADNVYFVPMVLELIAAVACFAVLPPPVWKTLRQSLLPDELTDGTAAARLRRSANACATEAARGFYELYLAMLAGIAEGRQANNANIHAVFDRASDHVCKSCVLCGQCWQRDYISTLAVLNDVSGPMLRRGKCELSDFPSHFADRCVRLPELMQAINSALFALREREQLRRREEENRTLLARQYAGVSDILRQLGAETSRDIVLQPQRERQVRRYAAAFGWFDRVSVFRDGSNRLVVELYGTGAADVLEQGAGFASGLSALLGVGLSGPKQVEDAIGPRIVLRERAPFRAVVGIARQQKAEASVSGDSGCYFVTDTGTACLLLADGMGSGAAAARDSHALLTVMERFLRAGVSASDALRTIAPTFRLRSDGARFVTLDALSVDLFTGRAHCVRCGAAPSWMRISGVWSRLDCKTLPIGLEESTEPQQSTPLRFAHGDLYIMLSDGVSDGQEDEWLRALLQKHAADGPKELAARLVQEAGNRGATDDRTALVLRIEHTECK